MTIEPEDLVGAWPERDSSAHKGNFGHLLIVAGSVGKTGAAVMAAEAALRAGVGLVTVACAASAIPMMAPRLLEAMWEPLPETPSGAIAFDAAERLAELLSGRRCAGRIGPGYRNRRDHDPELQRRDRCRSVGRSSDRRDTW